MAVGHTPGVIPAPTELLAFLKDRYMLQGIGEAGQPATPSWWDTFKESVGHDPEKIQVAAQAIKHFIQHGQAFMAQHQPVNMHYLAEGMGMELAGGFMVSFLAPEHQAGHMGMEPAGDIPVTIPRSQVGQHGIEPGNAVGITGVNQEAYNFGQPAIPPYGTHQAQLPPAAPAANPPPADPNDPLAQ